VFPPQGRPDKPARWEEIGTAPHRANMNVILRSPVNAATPTTTPEGVQTTPVVYDSGCSKRSAALTMVINGQSRKSV